MVTARGGDAAAMSAASVSPNRRQRRLSGLDGLRALAVGGVLIFHAGSTHLPGGFLGVDLFFVISGFLITWLLLAERQVTGAISLSRFYLRRARRLLPALAAMVGATTVFMAAFHRDDLAEARGDIGAAAGYFSNWWYVLHHRSYFAAAGRPPPLQHLWSLAVEEQFYLVWPLIVIILVIARVRLRWVFAVAAVGAVASAWWMRVLAIRGNVPFDTDSARLYYGTDTHASALLIGAAGAAVMTGLARRRARLGRDVGRAKILVADIVGLAAIAGVCWMMYERNSVSPDLYRGGFFAFAAVAIVAVVTVSLPGSRAGALLDLQPLRWIGTRSYGLYLWHWPVFVYTRPQLDWSVQGWQAFAVRMAVTAALTELTFQMVERPIREIGLKAWLRGGAIPPKPWLASLRRLPSVPRVSSLRRRVAPSFGVAAPMLAAVCGLVVVIGGTTLIAKYRPGASPTHSTANGGASSGLSGASPTPTWPSLSPSVSIPGSPPASSLAPPASASRSATSTPKAPTSTRTPTHTPTQKPPAPPPAGKESDQPAKIPAGPPPPLSAVGDSVMIDGEVALKQDCPGAEVYAVIGWQAKSVFEQIDKLRQAGHLGAIVVIGTGTNGVVSGKELDAVLTSLADRSRVVVVNDHMDRAWTAPNNTMFPQVVAKHDNAVLVDWDAAAKQHPEWFESDGIHLKPAGRQPYADLIQAAAGC